MMKNLPNEIPSLLIPMLGRPMLLPNLAVAEIATWEDPSPVGGMPEWFIGHYAWRGIEIPMISLELMNDPTYEDATQGRRVAVLNGLGGAPSDFYAVVVQGIPRLVRAYPAEIGKEEQPEDQPAFALLVSVSGERAMIPDLDYVEKQLQSVVNA
jgi:chemosensory pili system protein ChpC